MRPLRWVALVMLVVTCAVIFTPAPSFADEGLIDLHKLLPGTSTPNKADNDVNYVFDQKKGFFGGEIGEFLANNVFGLQKLMVKTVISIVVMSYKLDVYGALTDQIVLVMLPIKLTIFDNFFVVAIALFILSILSAGQAMKTNSAIISFAKGALIIGFSLYFITYPAQSLNLGKNLMQALNNELIKNTALVQGGGSGAAVNTDEAMVELSNTYWERYIEGPWIHIEFDGNKAAEAKYKAQLLALKPGSSEREALVESLRNENPVDTTSWGITILFILILQLFIFIPVLVLAAVNIASSSFVLLTAVFASIVFVLSLMPFFGSRLFVNWLFTLLGFFAVTVAVTLGLTVMLQISDLCYKVGGKYGLGVTFLLQAIIMIMLFLWRKKFINMASAMRYGGNGINKAIEHPGGMHEQAKSDWETVKNGATSTQKGVTKAYKAGTDLKKYAKKNEHVGAASDAELADVVGDRGINTDMNYRKAVEEPEMEVDYNFDENGNARMGYRETVKASGEYLWAKYKIDEEQSRQKADEREALFGFKVEPEESAFVKRTNANIAAGKDPFSADDMSRTIGMFNRAKKEGKNFETLYKNLREDEKPEDRGSEPPPNGRTETPKQEQDETHHEYSEKKAADGRSFENDFKTHREKEQKVVVEGTVTNREVAEVFLKKQFDLHMNDAYKKAQDEAARTGKSAAPSYDEFASKVRGRMGSGKPAFSKAEIDKAERFMENMHKNGQDAARFVNDMDKAVDMSQYMNLKKEVRSKVTDIDKSGPADKKNDIHEILKKESEQNKDLDDVKKTLEDMKEIVEEVKNTTDGLGEKGSSSIFEPKKKPVRPIIKDDDDVEPK